MKTLIEIHTKKENNAMIFEFSGELDETNADATFKTIKERIAEENEKNILFDVEQLKYLNSKSIGYIADIYSSLDENGGKLVIAKPDSGVKDVLELVGITTIVETVDTLEEAFQLFV